MGEKERTKRFPISPAPEELESQGPKFIAGKSKMSNFLLECFTQQPLRHRAQASEHFKDLWESEIYKQNSSAFKPEHKSKNAKSIPV